MLLVQGFQRAFVELGNPAFSVSAAMRRSTCEQVLKFARASGWTIVHSYLETNSSSLQAAALDGFTPAEWAQLQRLLARLTANAERLAGDKARAA